MISGDISIDHRRNIHGLEALLLKQRESLLWGLAGRRHHSLCGTDGNLSHGDEQLLRGGYELFRPILQKAAQKMSLPLLCPHGRNKFKADANCEVVSDLKQLCERVEGAAREVAAREATYLLRLNDGTAEWKNVLSCAGRRKPGNFFKQ